MGCECDFKQRYAISYDKLLNDITYPAIFFEMVIYGTTVRQFWWIRDHNSECIPDRTFHMRIKAARDDERNKNWYIAFRHSPTDAERQSMTGIHEKGDSNGNLYFEHSCEGLCTPTLLLKVCKVWNDEQLVERRCEVSHSIKLIIPHRCICAFGISLPLSAIFGLGSPMTTVRQFNAINSTCTVCSVSNIILANNIHSYWSICKWKLANIC